MYQSSGSPTPPEPPTPESNYVQSGLILHLDAKVVGNTSNAWTSLVGDYVFTNYGAVFNEDHVYFDGVDDYLSNTSFVPPSSGTGTIEIVYEADSEKYGSTAMTLFAGKTSSGLCYYLSSVANVYWSIGATQRMTPRTTSALASVSISNARKYENGTVITNTSSNFLGGLASTNYIGKRSSGNPFKGKIFSIRIYNRQLTEEEVFQNLAEDNTRFNLGLTL